MRAAERGEKRRILELAERNARLALDQERLRGERRRQSRVEALDGCRTRSGSTPSRCVSKCFDISNLLGTQRSPRWSCSRAGRRRSPTTAASGSARSRRAARRLRGDGRGAVAPAREMGAPGRHLAARHRLRRELRGAAQPDRDRRRQGPAGRRPRAAARLSRARRGVVSLAKRIEEVFVPEPRRAARARPRHARAAAAAARPRRGAPVRDHPPPQPPRQGDDGVGARRPPRRRPFAQARAARHFGSPDAVVAPPARNCRRCRACPRRSGATCTRTCTGPGASRARTWSSSPGSPARASRRR